MSAPFGWISLDLDEVPTAPANPADPAFLYNVGMGAGAAQTPLHKTLAMIAAEIGAMNEDQFKAILDGYRQGVMDFAQYLQDMQEMTAEPVESPF